MNGNLFRGELVRLTAEEPELLGKTILELGPRLGVPAAAG